MLRFTIILFLLMSGFALVLYGQEPVYMPGGASDIGSFWAMARLGGWIGYVIMGVLALGLFLIIYKRVDLFMDKRDSQKLRQAAFHRMGLDEIESMTNRQSLLAETIAHLIEFYRAGGQTSDIHQELVVYINQENELLAETIAHLIEFYRAGGQTSDIHQELVVYINQENERFETFRGWLNFLSDSAGALGLLGTVWGVFLTFFGGSLDSEKILNGMGVALITTLLGLVVSLIINLFNTQISSLFQRRL
jgi:biopolymer transport protein ExbB/TolQ